MSKYWKYNIIFCILNFITIHFTFIWFASISWWLITLILAIKEQRNLIENYETRQ